MLEVKDEGIPGTQSHVVIVWSESAANLPDWPLNLSRTLMVKRFCWFSSCGAKSLHSYFCTPLMNCLSAFLQHRLQVDLQLGFPVNTQQCFLNIVLILNNGLWVSVSTPQVMYLFLHTVKGTPFETPDQGKARLLTHWEQMDYGIQFTSSRKFLTISPIIL